MGNNNNSIQNNPHIDMVGNGIHANVVDPLTQQQQNIDAALAPKPTGTAPKKP